MTTRDDQVRIQPSSTCLTRMATASSTATTMAAMAVDMAAACRSASRQRRADANEPAAAATDVICSNARQRSSIRSASTAAASEVTASARLSQPQLA